MSKRIPRERIAEPRLTEGWCDLLNIDPASVQVEGRDNVFDILHCEFVMACGIPGPHMKEMWDTSIVSIKKYLADETPSGLWFGHADMITGKRTKTWFGALDAFFPGSLVLAGDIEMAARLQESCLKMWNRHGIEPEDFDYMKMEAARPRYFLNPEIMESAYYLIAVGHG